MDSALELEQSIYLAKKNYTNFENLCTSITNEKVIAVPLLHGFTFLLFIAAYL